MPLRVVSRPYDDKYRLFGRCRWTSRRSYARRRECAPGAAPRARRFTPQIKFSDYSQGYSFHIYIMGVAEELSGYVGTSHSDGRLQVGGCSANIRLQRPAFTGNAIMASRFRIPNFTLTVIFGTESNTPSSA